jgi:hypothetical protein
VGRIKKKKEKKKEDRNGEGDGEGWRELKIKGDKNFKSDIKREGRI